MYVIQVWPGIGDPELHRSFYVTSTLAMEACYRSLCGQMTATTVKPEDIKWDYDGFTDAYVGKTEYGFDYEIYRLKPSG